MFSTKLSELVSAIVESNATPAQVGEFATLCRRIAAVQLRRKVSSGKLNADFFRMSIEDLALDCIADLLQRDDDGSLVQIAAYFQSLSYQTLEDEELLAHLRRLVYGKVNQSLFRMYNELDPSLGKVLRNMKLAFQSVQTLTLADRLGEQFMMPSLCETLEHLPQMDGETLDRKIREFFHESRKMPQLLGRLASFLREQSDYSRLVPIMTVAVVLRSIFAGDNDVAAEVRHAEDQLYVEDASNIIKDACRRVMKDNHAHYVRKKSVPPEIFAKYFEVIELNLHQKFIGEDGELFSFYESLKLRMPGLSNEDYRREHRARLEYLAQQSHERAIGELRKHM